MLLQTNSYVVPKERRAEHARLVRRFRQVLHRLGCDQFEVYEQVGTNWTSDQSSGRYVQIMRFRDRKHQLAVQSAERDDSNALAVIAEFCELINFPYQQQQGLFAIGYYTAVFTSGKLLDGPEPAQTQVPTAPFEEPEPVAIPAISEPMTMHVEESELTGESSDIAHGGAPIRNPFADAPIVAPAEPVAATQAEPADEGVLSAGRNGTGSNGNGHPHLPVDDTEFVDDLDLGEPGAMRSDSMPQSAAEDLEQLIKQHFGDEGPGRDSGRNGDNPDPPLPGSGIGAVLDAGLDNDDDDLDVPLPAELIDHPDLSGPHTFEKGHPGHHSEDSSHG
jgi:hypothetical protein